MNINSNDLLTIMHTAVHQRTQPAGKRFTGVSTDSRMVKPGNIFFAIRGEKFDGHEFINNAFVKGATAVVVDERHVLRRRRSSGMVVVVPDTTKAFGEFANVYRKKFKIPVIAVAGSNGKTTTKEMVTAVLESRFRVLSTEKNFNNHIGVPQTLFRLTPKHEIAVVEIGTNHFGELKYLCRILEPTHGIITNIGREHLEFFKNIRGVARAEGELFRYLDSNGTGFVNYDDGLVVREAKKLKNKITYGFSKSKVNMRGTILSFDHNGCPTFSISMKNRKKFVVPMSIPGARAAMNGLAAASVGLTFGVSPKEIRRALEDFTAVGKRMEVLRMDSITVLNDSYNSNPDSVLAALEVLQSIKTDGKKIVVLGDMLELGSAARREHEHIGRVLGKMGFQYLLTYGPLARFIADKANVDLKIHYERKDLLIACVKKLLADGGCVLVKGSRGMKMEDVVISLTERFKKKVA
jgi:UDP-N-acetylmuramoyl-tripeptide--D-alanyl-D-alanine ligase